MPDRQGRSGKSSPNARRQGTGTDALGCRCKLGTIDRWGVSADLEELYVLLGADPPSAQYFGSRGTFNASPAGIPTALFAESVKSLHLTRVTPFTELINQIDTRLEGPRSR
jgi:hypothetical protein